MIIEKSAQRQNTFTPKTDDAFDFSYNHEFNHSFFNFLTNGIGILNKSFKVALQKYFKKN